MKALLLALVLFAAVSARRPRWNELEGYSFDRYIQDYNKPHTKGTSAYAMRKKIFDARLEEVRTFNQDTTQTYKKGINHMSDWTEDERRGILGNNVAMKAVVKSKPTRVHQKSGLGLPQVVDYRNANPPILTAVKDQGMCGSCWAHSATESIESHWAINRGELFVLSQQQITSCTPNPQQCGGTGGCNGAIYELAFDYVTGNGGITQEWTYSYQSYFGNTPTCAYNASTTFPVVKLTGYTAVPSNDESAMADALANAGPLAISVQADTWVDYEGGVFTNCHYNISMDHAVQLVGYGHDYGLGMDYWIVRNSWSPAWGEAGYIRISRPKTTPCGWNVNNTQGGGCKGGPNTVWACGTCGIAWDAVYPNVSPN